MKTTVKFRNFLLLVLFASLTTILFSNCSIKKDKELGLAPTISDLTVTDITKTSAIVKVLITPIKGVELKNTDVIVKGPGLALVEISERSSNGFTAKISGLKSDSVYSFVASITDAQGQTVTRKSDPIKTLGNAPMITTLPADNIQESSATLYGIIKTNSLATKISFEYWETNERVVIINGTQITAAVIEVPVGTAINDTSFNFNIRGLVPSVTYSFRVKAKNSFGTSYGSMMQFKTPEIVATDVDGNTYKAKVFGNMVWMTENLRVKSFRDGTKLPAGGAYTNTMTYRYYGGVQANDSIYGTLYRSGVTLGPEHLEKEIAPLGWHVPTDAEWDSLKSYLKGKDFAKEFNVLFGGYCTRQAYDIIYTGKSSLTTWWSKTRSGGTLYQPMPMIHFVYYSIGNATFEHREDNLLWEYYGNSIRCVRDTPFKSAPKH